MRIAVAGAILLLLAACTSSAGAPPKPSSHQAPHLQPSSPSAPSPSGTPSAPDGLGAKVGVILPNRSARWRIAELAALQAGCIASRLDCVFANARGSAADMAAIAAGMETNGVRILVLVPVDGSAGAVERAARRAGVLTVEYDQHVQHGSAAAFVRPDTAATGRLLGQGLTHCPQVATGPVPYARIDAPANRVGGATQRGAYRRVLAQTTGWSLAAAATAGDATTARAATAEILGNFTGVRAVLATSDSTAAGVISALAARQRAGQVAVAGNGATIAGLQHVLAGTQCFTIYHPPADGAQALTATLVRLVHFEGIVSGHSVAAARGRRTPVIEFGGAQIVTRAGVKAVLDAGYADRAVVCAGPYASACAAAGI